MDDEVPDFLLEAASLHIEYPVDRYQIYKSLPRKLGRPMHTGIGWAIWVEEDFVLPWYLPLVITFFAFGLFTTMVAMSYEKGVELNFLTVGNFVLTCFTVAYSAWILREKDSKHKSA